MEREGVRGVRVIAWPRRFQTFKSGGLCRYRARRWPGTKALPRRGSVVFRLYFSYSPVIHHAPFEDLQATWTVWLQWRLPHLTGRRRKRFYGIEWFWRRRSYAA